MHFVCANIFGAVVSGLPTRTDSPLPHAMPPCPMPNNFANILPFSNIFVYQRKGRSSPFVAFTLLLQRPITCLAFKVAKSAWLHFTHQTETSPELWDGATVNTLFFPRHFVNIFETNPAELTISLLLLAHKHFFQDYSTFPLQCRQIMFATYTGRQWQRSEFFYTLSLSLQ